MCCASMGYDLTSELSHAGPKRENGTQGANRRWLQRFVRRRGHNLKNLRPTLRPRRDGRPCRGTSKSKQKTGRQARPKIGSGVAKEKTPDRRPTSAAWPNPLCAFAPLRLCVENGRQSKRKGAKTPSRNQSNGVTLAAERPSSATAAGERRWGAGAITKSPATRKRKARRLFAAALWFGDVRVCISISLWQWWHRAPEL